jgi:hypothetical protein
MRRLLLAAVVAVAAAILYLWADDRIHVEPVDTSESGE